MSGTESGSPKESEGAEPTSSEIIAIDTTHAYITMLAIVILGIICTLAMLLKLDIYIIVICILAIAGLAGYDVRGVFQNNSKLKEALDRIGVVP